MTRDFKEAFEEGIAWYAQQPSAPVSTVVCPTRDIFQGRLDNMHKELLSHRKCENETALLVAIAGEIGNNCFDHNLGQWRDVSGCRLQYGRDKNANWVLLADRGQGVFASLKRVLPTLDNDDQALEVAFSKRLSGRSPERRGNGLKFVRSIINGNDNRGLLFLSGKGAIGFGGLASSLQELHKKSKGDTGRGTFACVLWNST